MPRDDILSLILGSRRAAGQFGQLGLAADERAAAAEDRGFDRLLKQSQLDKNTRQLSAEDAADEATREIFQLVQERGGKSLKQKELPDILDRIEGWTPDLVLKWIKTGLVESAEQVAAKQQRTYDSKRGMIIDMGAGTATRPSGLPVDAEKPKGTAAVNGYGGRPVTYKGRVLTFSPESGYTWNKPPGTPEEETGEDELGRASKIDQLYLALQATREEIMKFGERTARGDLDFEGSLTRALAEDPELVQHFYFLLRQYQEFGGTPGAGTGAAPAPALPGPGAPAPQQSSGQFSKAWGG